MLGPVSTDHESIAENGGAEDGGVRPVVSSRGMVATSEPRAAEIGAQVLRAGGSAVDAALAANAALAVTEPTGCGPGGDLFAMVWDAGRGEVLGFNGSGRSSRALDLDGLRARLAANDISAIPARGGLGVTVPGCVDAWCALHERFGRLPLAEVLAPAVELARHGFEVSPVIAGLWARAPASFAGMTAFEDLFLPGGRAPAAGERFANPALAETLEAVGREGRAALYEGARADALVAAVTAAGGVLDRADLSGHRGEWVTPLAARYRDHELWELPPNGQGLAALQMARLLDGFDHASLRPLSAAAIHLAIEAKKLAFADRAQHYADPDFQRVPAERLLADDYMAQRRGLIDPGRAATSVAPGLVEIERGDTVYLAAVDDAGNMVSWIQSNYRGFGSGVVPEGCGFGLQDRGCGFRLDAGHANAFAPGKRPFHTIIPAMIARDGRPVVSFGVMGGGFQPQGHAQILSLLVDHGYDVAAAGVAPRWRHGDPYETDGPDVAEGGGTVAVEAAMPDEVVEGLRARGHRVERDDDSHLYGGYQAIAVEYAADKAQRRYLGASEPRKDGRAVGL